MTDPKIIVALDYDSKSAVEQLLPKLNPELCRVKVGKELFTSCGPDIVKLIQDQGFDVFLDLKFHDIPVTVAKACKAAANLGVWMMNVHALGGENMMRSALSAIQDSGKDCLLIAVTILTSHEQKDITQVGIYVDLPQEVSKLANLAHVCGLHGVVCSAQEASLLSKELDSDFLYVTPGIRLQDDSVHDQKRVMTPQKALRNGASYLVIGRSITNAKDPAAVLEQILQQLCS